MKRHHQHDDAHQGHDSFLDVVANVVGVLIIVVMLVGLRSQDPEVIARRAQMLAEKKVQQEASPAPANASAAPTPTIDLTEGRREVMNLRSEVQSLAERTESAAVESQRLLATRNGR